jgi:mannose-6-phosphate isomerase-like protein (cupin superfamily)
VDWKPAENKVSFIFCKGRVMKKTFFTAEYADVVAEGTEKNLSTSLSVPLRPLRLVSPGMTILFLSLTAFAQHKPSEATRPFVVMSAQSLDDLQKTLQPDNKTSELIESGGMQLRVAVQHEKNKVGAPAELHDASDDVYYVLEGSATLILGGKLADPKETDAGEWRSPRIIDGKTFVINKGDLVIVPRGTPHQRSTANKDFTMILIKIYAEPLKKKP